MPIGTRISSTWKTCPSDRSSPKKEANIFWSRLFICHPLRGFEFSLAFGRRLHNLAELWILAYIREQRIRLQCLMRAIVLRDRLAQEVECNLFFAASREQRSLVIFQLRILFRQ